MEYKHLGLNDDAEKAAQLWIDWRMSVAVMASMALQIVLLIGGPKRRRTPNPVLQLVAWLAYVSADAVAMYALGEMSQYSKCRRVHTIWAPMLLLHLAGPDTITAFSTQDNELWTRHALWMAYNVGVAAYVLCNCGRRDGTYLVPGVLLCIVGGGKYVERTLALRSASFSGLMKSTLPIYFFMPFENVIRSNRYNYLVMGENEWYNRAKRKVLIEGHAMTDTAVTVHDVLECPRIDGDDRIICVAHALFKMNKRRLLKMQLSEQDQRKASEFFTNGEYFSLKEEGFNVVETELDFTYDMLFTKAAGTAYTLAGILFRVVSSIFLSIAALLIFRRILRSGNGMDSVHMERSITFFLIVAALVSEMLHMCRIVMSDWTRVWLICTYAKHYSEYSPHKLNRLNRFLVAGAISLTKRCRGKGFWKQRIGQFCLLECCLEVNKRLKPWWYIWHLGIRFSVMSFQCFVMSRMTTSSEMPEDVKNLFIQKLAERISEERPIGKTDWLPENLQWIKISHVNLQETILYLHVATSVCEQCANNLQSAGDERKLCEILSRYCAYLLLSRTTLLPLHKDLGRMVLSRVFSSTVEHAYRTQGSNQFYEQLLEGEWLFRGPRHAPFTDDADQFTFWRGLWLAYNLQDKEEQERWRVLGKLWLDLVIHIALSDKISDHVEHLAMGGEFLTHLRVLLGHMGFARQAAQS